MQRLELQFPEQGEAFVDVRSWDTPGLQKVQGFLSGWLRGKEVGRDLTVQEWGLQGQRVPSVDLTPLLGEAASLWSALHPER